MTQTTDTKLVTKRPRKMAREPQVPETPGTETGNESIIQPVVRQPKRASKSSLVLELLTRPEGATIDQLVAASGWLPHTTRAALTGLKKKGHVITSEKIEGARRYRVGAGAD